MKECPEWFNWLVLIVGVLYLLTDLGTIVWWNLSWYTVLFLLWGLAVVLGSGSKRR